MTDVTIPREQAGAVHTATGGAVLTREHLSALAWLWRKEPKIPVEQEGAGPGGEEEVRVTEPAPVHLLRPDRRFPFPQPVRRHPRGPAGRSQTPQPTVSWASMNAYGTEASADTQMGVSTTHVVVTTRTHIAFYDKAGVPQGSPIYVGDFFAPLGLDTSFGISTYFDTRSIFDPYRKRFWLGALAIKHFPDKGSVPDDNLTKFAAAVSSTENPTDPWYLYWWDAVAHDGVQHDPVFQPGDWADYPILGVDAKCIYQVNAVNGKNRNYGHIIFFPAAEMAAGQAGPIDGWQFWDLEAPDGSKPTLITPSVHHGSNHRAFFAGPTYGSDKLLVWGLRDPLGPTQLMERAEVSISTLGGPVDSPQSGSKELIKMTNLGTQPLRASCRDNRLSVSLNDSADWLGDGSQIQSNRLIQLDLGGFPSVPSPGDAGYRERVFGLNNPLEDDPSSVFSYGWPVIETNHRGDTVLVYSRTGKTIDPEIRFSTWLHGESDIRPSRLLKSGENPYKLSWASPGPLPWADTGGISVDPFDDTAVWFAHCYADSHSKDGNYAIEVGKVFGSRWPRWLITIGAIQDITLRPHHRFLLALAVANAGDAPAPQTRAHVRLRGTRRDPIHVTELRLPTIPAGATVQLQLPVRIPRNVEEGMYDLEVAVDPHEEVEQYDRSGSTARRPILVAGDEDDRG